MAPRSNALAASADSLRLDSEPPASRPRMQQRVRQVRARALVDYEDTRELVSIMLDAVVAHRHLYEDVGVVHGDINPNTIVICEFDDAKPGAKADNAKGGVRAIGALVDYDGPLKAKGTKVAR
ncbi:hypothetical protein BV20DRAFT_974429 [Pilatotrama ljubarskyi]|nr:hypothetical protein BV20DRAFT_974429 [Pilatotrama ljubarskyi]